MSEKLQISETIIDNKMHKSVSKINDKNDVKVSVIYSIWQTNKQQKMAYKK